MKIKINPLTAVMILIAVIAGETELLMVTYLVLLLHELAHFAAAVCIGLKAESITFSPFGVHLTLKNKIVRSFSDEIILYAAGPLINGIAALICIRLGEMRLYRINTVLFILNLIPAVPLDGGIILKRILSRKIGGNEAERAMKRVSAVFAAALLALAVTGAVRGYVNPSLFAMAVFVIGNFITGNELYNVDFINGVSCGEKKNNKARLVIVDEVNPLIRAAEKISPAYTVVAAVTDRDGEIKELLTDKAILKRLTAVSDNDEK